MLDKAKTELRVGIFVFVGLAILFTFVFLIGDFYFFKPGWHLKIVFGFVNGVKSGAPVRVSGVDLGKVQGVSMHYDTKDEKMKVALDVWLNKNAKIPVDSKVWINTLGLLGEKYVEIIPGNQYESSLKDGDTIIGEDPISMQEMGAMAQGIADKLEEALNSINTLVTDEQMRAAFRESLNQLKETSVSLNYVLGRIKNGEGTIGRLVNDEMLYKDLEDFVADIKAHPWKLFFKGKEKAKVK